MKGEDRVVLKDGQPVRMSEAELESLLEVAFKAAAYQALSQLGVQNGNDIENISCSGGFGQDHITAHVRLKDGRDASASASLWSEPALAN